MRFIAFSRDRAAMHGHIVHDEEIPAVGMRAKLIAFAKKNVVLEIALLAAVATSFIVPPDREYLGYFDLKTLTCLFCVLAVVCALKNINSFIGSLIQLSSGSEIYAAASSPSYISRSSARC